ncbi:hypothetical protein [Paenibacillus xylanexedens]|uniref:hypothetical protein n=1 Tax=Paenibacillus xylanexedens TaxID=528191 RepID=UPI000FBC856A|nr:hypothetical protein [Paenibacillus xylanexedens]RPK29845.1 hypothetical protein EDO6_00469 [Paenibacillus xylanexedens]
MDKHVIKVSKGHAEKVGRVMEKMAAAGIYITRSEAAEHCIDWAHELLFEKGMKIRKK